MLALFDLPFNDLMYQAQQVHRANFDAADVELATLLSIKTGGCEEDCGYCPQAARYDTGVEAKKILPIETVLEAAREAKANGATEAEVREAIAMSAQTRHWSTVLNGSQIDMEQFKKEFAAMMKFANDKAEKAKAPAQPPKKKP